MRVLVCGGREYLDRDRVWTVLGNIHSQTPITAIIEGGATGADSLARSWAGFQGVVCKTFMADWRGQGRAAGPVRNARMIREGLPDMVVAFPGGAGTRDMTRKAEAARLKIINVLGGQK